MAAEFDPREILKKNPHISATAASDARKAVEKMEELGVRKKEYSLLPPFASRGFFRGSRPEIPQIDDSGRSEEYAVQ